MGRTRLVRAIARLEKELEKYKLDRKDFLDFTKNLNKKLIKKQISKYRYNLILKEKLKGKKLQEWLDYFDHNIKKYEKQIRKLSIREYINQSKTEAQIDIKKFRKSKKPIIISSIIIISLLLLTAFYFPNITNLITTITGLAIQEDIKTLTQNLNLKKTESTDHTIELEKGILESLQLSGEIEGEGEVKVYLNDLLILDSTNLESDQQASPITGTVIQDQDLSTLELIMGIFYKSYLTITGRASEDIDEEPEKKEVEEKPEKEQDEEPNEQEKDEELEESSSEENEETPEDSSPSPESSSPSETQESDSDDQEEVLEDSSPSREPPSSEDGPTIPSSSSEEEPENNETTTEETQNQNETETEDEQEELQKDDSQDEISNKAKKTKIKFKNYCEETCDIINLNLTKETYTLKIEINNAELFLNKLTYKIILQDSDDQEEVLEDSSPSQEPPSSSELDEPSNPPLSDNETNITPDLNITPIINTTTNQPIINTTTNQPIFINNIPNLQIPRNGAIEFSITEYFQNAENVYLLQNEYINSKLSGSRLRLEPDQDYEGLKVSKLIAENQYGIAESNFFNISVGKHNITEINITKPEINITENITLPGNITTNFTINVTTNITLNITLPYNKSANFSTLQYKAIINRPTKWIKTLNLKNINLTDTNLTLELPKEASNISIKTDEEVQQALEELQTFNETIETTDRKNLLLGSITGNVALDISNNQGFLTRYYYWLINLFKGITITGNVIQEQDFQEDIQETNETKLIDLEQIINETNAKDIAVEYYTNGPTAFEETIGKNKKVKISGPDELNYTDILTFTEIPEIYNVGQEDQIQIYWEENDTYVNFNALDLNNNNYLDYVEWIVPHLSNQTYNIILIIKADHLDENRTFISDIYEDVKELDNNWSETIPDQHYVRVTFEVNLTSDRDITIYPRTISGNPKVEVYEFNNTKLIAEFTTINDNQYNKVFLTNLNGTQDVFDLRITNGELQFDHIIDPVSPPDINFILDTPSNTTKTTNTTLSLNVSISNSKPVNKSIWNWNGTNYTIYNDSLVFFMNFDNVSDLGEGDDNTNLSVDLSNYGNNGSCEQTGYGVGCNYSTGKYGRAAHFNGSTYLNISDDGSLDFAANQDFAISFWINPDDLSGTKNIIDKGFRTGASDRYVIQINASENILQYIAGSFAVKSDTKLTVGEWTHIVALRTVDNGIIYINGIFDATATAATGEVTNTDELFIGARTDGVAGFYEGSLDDLQIWDKNLSTDEVYQLYATSFSRYNNTRWYLTVNQSLNASDGLAVADDYTYFASVTDQSGYGNRTDIRTINITAAADNTPQIIFMFNNTITDVTSGPNEGPGGTSVIINFSASDADGAADLNESTAFINFSRSGETTREKVTCDRYESSGNNANYSCNVTMFWYDGSGTWDIIAEIYDNSSNSAINDSTNFFVGARTAFVMSPATLTWSGLSPGSVNQTSNNDPLVLNNTGNYEIATDEIGVNATDLLGETDSSFGIWAGNISVYTFTGSTVECNRTATNMTNSTMQNITASVLPKGNFTINDGSTGQEELYFCIKEVGSELTAQSYSTEANGAWIIRILLVAFTIDRFRKLRKKTKKKTKTKKLKKKKLENLSLPSEIFSNKLGCLEAISKYIKDNLEMSYSEIATILNRNDRTIWTAYKKAIEKDPKPFKLEKVMINLPTIKLEKIFIVIPVSIFENNSLTTLEAIIVYLKDKGLKFNEIGKLLNRDQRNIWTIYSKAIKK